MILKDDSPSKKGKPLIASTGLRQFMFLASHGLRNPLTAIRWSCGRLEKVEKHSDMAMNYLQEIERNTTRLTRILGAIFLISRLQDQIQPLQLEPHSFGELLRAAIPAEEDASFVKLSGDTNVYLESDKEILHSLFACVFMGCYVAFGGGEIQPINVSVKNTGGIVQTTFHTEALLQFLRTGSPKKFRDAQETDLLIGGTTGLLLALARDLAVAMGGYLKLEHDENSFMVSVSLPSEPR